MNKKIIYPASLILLNLLSIGIILITINKDDDIIPYMVISLSLFVIVIFSFIVGMLYSKSKYSVDDMEDCWSASVDHHNDYQNPNFGEFIKDFTPNKTN